MDIKQRIANIIEDKREELIAASDQIWGTPETRFATDESVKPYYDILEDEGFQIEKGLASMPNAFVASYGSGNPVIGILAEYDALSNLSQVADLGEKKAEIVGGNGHGCGHNLLGIGSLAGAIGIKEYMAQTGLNGTIKLFGCPAEESGYGKAFMARDGIFDGIDVALSWHPMDVNTGWGDSSLSVYQVYYKFKGTSSHAAAAPEQGRSALDAAELMNMGVQFLREHIIDSGRIHYAFTDAGGESANVVQPSAGLYYFIRAPFAHQAEEIYKRVNKVAEGAAHMTETELEIEFDSACLNYIPNKALTTKMYENLKTFEDLGLTDEDQLYGKRYNNSLSESEKQNLYNRARGLYPDSSEEELMAIVNKSYFTETIPLQFSDKTLGSTDVGDVSWVVPTAQVTIACEPQGTPPHSWQWVANGKSDVAHKGMLTAGKVIATTAYDLLTQPDLLEIAATEHQRNLNGQSYKSGIPKEISPK